MGLMLAEKPVLGPWRSDAYGFDNDDLSGSPPYDIEAATELSPWPLLMATGLVMAATLFLWFTPNILRASARLLVAMFAKRNSCNPEANFGVKIDASSGLRGASTPPPTNWLRDLDDTSPRALATPEQEPLLFSLSPPAKASPGKGTSSGMGVGKNVGVHAINHGIAAGGASSVFVGWDPALLARQSALLPAISSVEGLTATAEFQEYMRTTRRRSPNLERNQAHAKNQLYKDLRRVDPEAFARLLSRNDIKSYDARLAPLSLVLFDYIIGTLVLPLMLGLLWYEKASSNYMLGYGPLLVWLVTKLWLAASGHTSLLGRARSTYLVYDSLDGSEDPEPNGWESLVGLGGHVLLLVVEVVMAACSLGLLAVGAVLSIVLSRRRKTLAMRLMGLHFEQELSRPTKLSPFCPSSEATTPLQKNGISFVQRPGRYGLSPLNS